MNLKDAQKKGKLKDFIKEREKDAPGDKKRFEKTLKKISQGKKSEAPETSDPGSSEN